MPRRWSRSRNLNAVLFEVSQLELSVLGFVQALRRLVATGGSGGWWLIIPELSAWSVALSVAMNAIFLGFTLKPSSTRL